MQNCSNSIADALELLQSCTEPSICIFLIQGDNTPFVFEHILAIVPFNWYPHLLLATWARICSVFYNGQVFRLLVMVLNALKPRQNGRGFPNDIFKCIFFNGNAWILVKISQKLVLRGAVNNITALVLIMARHRPGNKPLPELMMVSLCIYTSLGLNELNLDNNILPGFQNEEIWPSDKTWSQFTHMEYLISANITLKGSHLCFTHLIMPLLLGPRTYPTNTLWTHN